VVREVEDELLIIRIVFLGLFSLAGYYLPRIFSSAFALPGWLGWLGLAIGFVGGAAIIYGEMRLEKQSGREILAGVLGLILGLVVAFLISMVVIRIPAIGKNPSAQLYVVVFMALILGYLGTVVGIKKRGDLRLASRHHGEEASAKILDTSVIIDGRIADICENHFIEGKIIVPKFVLAELQQIADSADPLKRNRGRRGLEILRRMQLRKDLEVVVDEHDPGTADDVDANLVKLARFRHAKIITNDFNLNKVAELHGIIVLNVNELANALKPVVLPSEEITVKITKRGKEADQGVGYLDDGTMVVVEGGSGMLNRTVDVIITSVLQTSVGRMIFARLR
jgi:uncharacterized protein YacL